MAKKIRMEKIDFEKEGTHSIELCKEEIPGARVFSHAVEKGDRIEFPEKMGCYRILLLVKGSACFATRGKEGAFEKTVSARITFVPDPEEDLTVTADSRVQLLEIQWAECPQDKEDLKKFKTVFPVVVPYQESIQYIDPNKSEKTISRMMIPHEVIPRFTIGSVESYGYDLVRPHAHPMLDQFFFSFPENDMDVLIDGEKIPMKGNEILHIPLGSDHGVEVTGDRHMHYVWIDFMPDQEAGLKRLNFSHRPTGTVRDFAKER